MKLSMPQFALFVGQLGLDHSGSAQIRGSYLPGDPQSPDPEDLVLHESRPHVQRLLSSPRSSCSSVPTWRKDMGNLSYQARRR